MQHHGLEVVVHLDGQASQQGRVLGLNRQLFLFLAGGENLVNALTINAGTPYIEASFLKTNNIDDLPLSTCLSVLPEPYVLIGQ